MTYFLISEAFKKVSMFAGCTRAPSTFRDFLKALLSNTSLEDRYGGGEASRYRWRDIIILSIRRERGRASMP